MYQVLTPYDVPLHYVSCIMAVIQLPSLNQLRPYQLMIFDGVRNEMEYRLAACEVTAAVYTTQRKTANTDI